MMEGQGQGCSRSCLRQLISFFILVLMVILVAESWVIYNDLHPKTTASAALQAAQPFTGCQPTSQDLASCFNGPAAADMSSGSIHLHVQTDGFGCENSLVLNGVRAVYDQGTLSQMSNYAGSFRGLPGQV